MALISKVFGGLVKVSVDILSLIVTLHHVCFISILPLILNSQLSTSWRTEWKQHCFRKDFHLLPSSPWKLHITRNILNKDSNPFISKCDFVINILSNIIILFAVKISKISIWQNCQEWSPYISSTLVETYISYLNCILHFIYCTFDFFLLLECKFLDSKADLLYLSVNLSQFSQQPTKYTHGFQWIFIKQKYVQNSDSIKT